MKPVGRFVIIGLSGICEEENRNVLVSQHKGGKNSKKLSTTTKK